MQAPGADLLMTSTENGRHSVGDFLVCNRGFPWGCPKGFPRESPGGSLGRFPEGVPQKITWGPQVPGGVVTETGEDLPTSAVMGTGYLLDAVLKRQSAALETSKMMTF